MKVSALMKAQPEGSPMEEGMESAEYEAAEGESEEPMDLSGVSDDELIAELKARGHEIEEAGEEAEAPEMPMPPMPPM